MSALSVEEASARILADVAPLPPHRVALPEALGAVLARDVRSEVALPPWDNSSMDGYAVRAADVRDASREAPVSLPVLETVAAGGRASTSLRPGTAIRIMTGAPVPDGADSVIRVEDTDRGIERVRIVDARDAGRNVRPRGEDVAVGATAVRAGTTLGAPQLGVLASVGAAYVEVHRRPRVALLTTGDELVDVDGFDAVRRGEAIVSSNSYTLAAAIASAGGVAVDLGIGRDDPEQLAERLRGADGCDLVITSGGVSVGAFDHVRDVVESLGGTLAFSRVRMRPGAPLSYGTLAGAPWIGLPGNPVSSLVTFELFARPAIRRMRGEHSPFRRVVEVELGEDVELGAPLTHFLRAIVRHDTDGRLQARLTGAQGSGLLTSMALANALVVIPAERARVAAGERVHAMLVTDDALHAPTLRLA